MNLIFPLLTLSLLLTNVDAMRIFQCSFREILWMVPERRRGAGLMLFFISLIGPFITAALPKCKCPTSQKSILKVSGGDFLACLHFLVMDSKSKCMVS